MKSCFITIFNVVAIILSGFVIADFASLQTTAYGSDASDLIYLIIFIFIVDFVFTAGSWSPGARKRIITFIVVYCLVNIFVVWTNFGVVCIRWASLADRVAPCMTNLQKLRFAVESYNECMEMDGDKGMEKLDIPLLVKSKSLYSELKIYDEDCIYGSSGNLTEGGVVFCTKHLTYKTKEELRDYDFYEALKNLSPLLKNDIEMAKLEAYKKKSILGKGRFWIRKNWPAIKTILYPVLVAFFPYSLHPLRKWNRRFYY